MLLDKISERAKNVISSVYGPGNMVAKLSLILSEVTSKGGLGSLALGSDVAVFSEIAETRIGLNQLIEQAFLEAFEMRHPYVGTEHLLLSALKIAKSKEYKPYQKRVLSTGTYPQGFRSSLGSLKKSPLLDVFGVNLNELSEGGKLGNLVERDEISDLTSILLQRERANALIVGDDGVGKSSLVRLLAQKISNFEVPQSLSNVQIIEFDMHSFLGSVVSREGLEAGLSALHDEILALGGVFLYIRDIHTLFAPTGSFMAQPFLESQFKSYILYSGIQMIASTTPQAYQKHILDNEDLSSEFSPVRLKEPDGEKTLRIMEERSLELEKYHSLKIEKKTVEEAYRLAGFYLKGRRFPQKGIELLDKASALLLMDKTMLPKRFSIMKKKKYLLTHSLNKAVSSGNLESGVALRKKLKALETRLSQHDLPEAKRLLTDRFLEAALSKEIDVPVGRLERSEVSAYASLPGRLKKRVVGQTKAINLVAKALVRSRFDLRTRQGTIGSFLFLGPTGVGKTELARVLSDEMFGGPPAGGLIKLDMSDFSERHTVSRLVGAPPGYIGYSEGGELTEKIAKNPFSVVLFDEIEKAHPDVLNILLQIMDDGVLVDAKGRSFDFSHSVVILTSNLGSELINKGELGYSMRTDLRESDFSKVEARLLVNLKEIMKPELLNRLDEVVVFNKLTKRDMEKILSIIILEVSGNLENKGFILAISKEAKVFLLKEGFSEEYGARALRRTVNKLLVDEIAERLVKGEGVGSSEISVSFKDRLVFEFRN